MAARAGSYRNLREPLTFERGYLDVFQPAAPAAGSNLSYTTARFNAVATRLISAVVVVTTDANAANRQVNLEYVNARGLSVVRFAPTVVLTASTPATTFRFTPAVDGSEWNVGTPVFAPLEPLLLEAGWTIQVSITNIQVGDTITAPVFLHEHFYADSLSDPDEE
jgi:hypothetical protein